MFRTAFSVSTVELFQRLGQSFNLYEWIEDCFPEPEWGGWSSWSECDRSCATPEAVGRRRRERACAQVVRDGLTVDCPGLGIDEETCNEQPCEVPSVSLTDLPRGADGLI